MAVVDLVELKSKFQFGDKPDESAYINLIDTLSFLPMAGSGPQGIPGIDGVAGIQGLVGEDGAVGAQGVQGLVGEDGAVGAQGLKGDSGLTGVQGQQGSQGQAGASVTLKGSVANAAALSSSNNTIGDSYINDEDGNLYVWTGTIWYDSGQIVGPEGPQGVRGVQGLTGNTGPIGPIGTVQDITIVNNAKYLITTQRIIAQQVLIGQAA